MENLEAQQFREGLAKKIKNTPKHERKEVLDEAKRNPQYWQARGEKIQEVPQTSVEARMSKDLKNMTDLANNFIKLRDELKIDRSRNKLRGNELTGENENKKALGIQALRDFYYQAVQIEPSFRDKNIYQFSSRQEFNEAITFTERCWQKIQEILGKLEGVPHFIIGSFAVDARNGIDAIGRPHNDLDVVIPIEELDKVRQVLEDTKGVEDVKFDPKDQTLSSIIFLGNNRDERNFSLDFLCASHEAEGISVKSGVFGFSDSEFHQKTGELMGYPAKFASKESILALKQLHGGRLIDKLDIMILD